MAKRVLITGHTGFHGSWLALCLHSLGADLTGFALDPPTRPSLYEVARLAQVVSAMRGTALEATVGWYKAFIAGLDMRRFTQEQIETRME